MTPYPIIILPSHRLIKMPKMKFQEIPAKQAGFSLIDLMVGAIIGLLTTLVIMYSFKAFEGQKRTTDSLAGAQSDGLLAMITLDNAIRPAGLGLFANGSLICSSVNVYYNGSVVANGASMMPVNITDGGASGGSDSIQTMTSQSQSGAASAAIAQPMPTPSSVLTVTTGNGFSVGGLVMVGDPSSPTTPCTVMSVTALQNTANGVNLIHNSGLSPWNPPNLASTFSSVGPYSINAVVVPLGSFSRTQFQVLCHSLAFTDLNSGSTVTPSCAGSTFTNAAPMAANVVNIQAQYGIVPPSLVGGITCWVNATGAGTNACDGNNWLTPTPANIQRIEAIHVAVTVMSPQKEKPDSSGVCTATASTTATNYPVSWAGGPIIDVTTIQNWQCYRYKVFQTIIPVRNAIWAN